MSADMTRDQTGSLSKTFDLSGRLPGREVAWAMWTHRWIGIAISLASAMIAGALIASVMPRGPITSTQALGLMATGLVVGVIAGFTTRSRWPFFSRRSPLSRLRICTERD